MKKHFSKDDVIPSVLFQLLFLPLNTCCVVIFIFKSIKTMISFFVNYLSVPHLQIHSLQTFSEHLVSPRTGDDGNTKISKKILPFSSSQPSIGKQMRIDVRKI